MKREGPGTLELTSSNTLGRLKALLGFTMSEYSRSVTSSSLLMTLALKQLRFHVTAAPNQAENDPADDPLT